MSVSSPGLKPINSQGIAPRSNQWYQIRQYLDRTGRTTWESQKPFFDDGLARGGETTNNFALGLTWLRERPSAAYVQGVVDGYDLPKHIVDRLKSAYKLE